MKTAGHVLEIRLQRAAVAVCLCVLVLLGCRWAHLAVRGVRLEARLAALQGEGDRLAEQTRSVEEELSGLEQKIRQVSRQISDDLKTRGQLDVAMADVLARVRMLREQKDQFESLQRQIRDGLDRMQEHYLRIPQGVPPGQDPM